MMIETSTTNTDGKLPTVDNTEKEFEDILNQLNALGNTIDQELSNAPGKLFGNKLNGELSLKTNSLTNTSATTANNRINQTDLIGLNYSNNNNNNNININNNNNHNQTGTVSSATILTNNSNNNNNNLPQNSLLSAQATSGYYSNNNNHHHHQTSSYHNHQTNIGLVNGGGGTQYYPSSAASVLSGNGISTPVTGSLNDSQPATSLNGHEIKSQHSPTEQQQQTTQDCNEMNKSQAMSNYFTSSPMHHGFVHHDHHLHHYHPMYPGHDVSTPPVLSDDNSGHDTSGMGLINLISSEHHHQLRTDSPDNDSAFSDSISLIYSEQSSSSSSNGKMNGSKGTSSGQSSQSVNSSGSSSSCEDNQNHHLPHHHHSHHIHHHTGNNNKLLHQTSPMPMPVASGKQNTIASILSPSASSTSSSTASSAVTASSASSSSLSSSATAAAAATVAAANTKTKLTPEAIDGFDDNNPSHQQQQQLLFEQNEKEKDDDSLYLKVFAEDDSSKCLLADERMNVGAICSQMAQKNHIALGMNYCIMEHMPQLYLERFYEDHESLVENVLYWGRDSTNKLYFVQQPDKYDLFVQPEKYLISVSQPNENADTLKSGSLRAKYNANQLRSNLIGQFFTKTSTGNVRVPEIEGNLYLRSEGKKVWKKYFFSLRSSGLYYCPKGKPKSTKDLICLTTFELNCIYYGFGWKKKFKAPNDFGFAIKHPQIQMKSPKHIKYLCAENRDELKLWITGIRIAKYGHQLLVNYEQFNNLSSTGNPDDIDSRTITKKISSFTLNNSNNNLPNVNYDSFGDESQFGHLHQSSSSITMRTNRVPRSDSVRSSSASSSSGCMSEQSSIVSTPSSGSGGIAGTAAVHENTNYHHHLQSPHHQPLPPTQQQTPLNAFDADFPVGTIKRKPNVMIQPKIPLTNTTRNLALQSDDALLEVSDGSSGGSCGDDESSCCMNSMPNHHPTNPEQFQRGTFKTGTLRRSNADDRSKTKMNLLSPQHQFYLPKSSESMNHSDDELPPPPPPPPMISNLKEAESTLSLNANFPPPPPPEILNSSPVNSLTNIQNTNQQPQSTPPPNSPLKPPSMAALPLPPMTPQPQMKHRLARRLSDLSENSTYFMNHRNNYDVNIYGTNGQQPHIPAGIYSPNSRASIASSSDSTSFITLKSNFINGRRFHRQNSLEYYSQQPPTAWSKYGTSPRLRPFEQSQPTPSTPPTINGNVMGEHFYRQTPPPTSPPTNNTNYAPFAPAPSGPTHVSNSHCALISDGPVMNGRNDYNFGQTQIPPPLLPPPPPPSSTNMDSINQSHYGANNYPNKSSLKTQENHYMSISPHLIQKHQQMLQQQKQQQIYSGNNCPNGPSMSYHVPEDIFLKNMERVMQKKWHVAQMLQQDSSSTPGQVLGFRDSAYLPPGQAPVPAPVLPPPPPPESHVHLQSAYASNTNYKHYNGTVNSPAHYPSPVPTIESSASLSYPSSPYHHSMNGPNNLNVKTVQFADNNNSVSMTPPITPIHQPANYQNNYDNHYHQGNNNTGTGNNNNNKRVPPPPPKRSESTQLTISCPSRR